MMSYYVYPFDILNCEYCWIKLFEIGLGHHVAIMFLLYIDIKIRKLEIKAII